MTSIRRIAEVDSAVADGLCTLLIDAVHGGASVGFLAPLSPEVSRGYWGGVAAGLAEDLVLWVAELAGEVVGSVQLSLCGKQNGQHRAEVQKLFVLRAWRGKGIASLLMNAVEDYARHNGRTLLVLDTVAGEAAESVYRHFGWSKVGEIPAYAAMPDGALRATAYYFKQLAD